MLELLQDYGVLGLFFGAFLAATVIPFSSEILLTGVLIAGVSPLHAFFAATIGNWLGGLTSYYVGHLGRWDIIERWFGVKEERLVKQKARIEKYGSLIAFFTWLPIIGDLLAIGLGFYRIDVIKSAIFMLIGRSIRFALWISLFYFVGERILQYKFL
ncbi:MAG: YqaA family protein [Bacteroidales bacterium]|nr:YqaA family protein [Bacteroidales bacterium]